MAVIICTECGKEISNEAIKCPNCGCPTKREHVIKAQNTMSRFKVLSTILGFIMFANLLCLLFLANWFWTKGEKYEFEKSNKYTTTLANEMLGTYPYKTFDDDLIKEGNNIKKLKNVSSVITPVFIILFVISISLYKHFKNKYENYKGALEEQENKQVVIY